MPQADIPFGVGDRAPLVRRKLVSGDGNPIPLAGATVVFLYRDEFQANPQQSIDCTIIDADNGIVEFTWPGEAVGVYFGQFKVILASGLPMHIPNNRKLRIEVIAEP